MKKETKLHWIMIFCFLCILNLVGRVSYGQIAMEPTPEQQKARMAFAQPVYVPKTFGEKIVFYAKKYDLSNKDIDNAFRIMKCESGLQPHPINKNNKDKSWDWLWWQINDKRWKEPLKKLGFDITDPDDNLEAGFYLYATYGVKLWKPSAKCHKLV